MCGNRRVLFDNKTVDKWMKSEQLTELLYLVNEVVDKNSGKPYTNELFLKFRVCFFFSSFLFDEDFPIDGDT